MEVNLSMIKFEPNEDLCDEELDDEMDYLNDDQSIVDENTERLSSEVITKLFINKNLNHNQIIQSSTDKRNGLQITHTIINDENHEQNEINCLNKHLIKSNKCFKFELNTNESHKRKSGFEERNGKKLCKSDVQINEIPQTFVEFLKMLFELNATLIEDSDSKLLFREETQYREIKYRDHKSYVNSFIPFIFRQFWSASKDFVKDESNILQLGYTIIEGNKIECYHKRRKVDDPVLKFSQLLVLNYNKSDINKEKLFGIVQDVESALISNNNDQMIESAQNDFIVDKITVFCNPEGLEKEIVSIKPLKCVQHFLLQLKTVFELKLNFSKILDQVLKPKYKFDVTGLSVNMEDRKDISYYSEQFDAIQKSYEVCCAPEVLETNFVAIHGPKRSGKTEILKETVLQLLYYAQTRVDKLIVISNNNSQISSLIELLKEKKIRAFHIDCEEKYLFENKKRIKRQVNKLIKEKLFKDIETKYEQSFQQCLKFYNEDIEATDLSMKDQFVREKIESIIMEQLMSKSKLIIGSIESICNDRLFNCAHMRNNPISCALIDNACDYTEPELLSLLNAGVKGFVLFGNIYDKSKTYENVESFLQRYIRLYNNDNSNLVPSKKQQTSVVRLQSIESRQRYEENLKRKNRDHRRFGNSRFNSRFNSSRNGYRNNNFRGNYNGVNRGRNGIKNNNYEDRKPQIYNNFNRNNCRFHKNDNKQRDIKPILRHQHKDNYPLFESHVKSDRNKYESFTGLSSKKLETGDRVDSESDYNYSYSCKKTDTMPSFAHHSRYEPVLHDMETDSYGQTNLYSNESYSQNITPSHTHNPHNYQNNSTIPF